MSTYGQEPYQERIRTLRLELKWDLERFLEVDPAFFGGYVLGWLATELDVEDLERLVEQLDSTVRVDGHRVLDRPAGRRSDL